MTPAPSVPMFTAEDLSNILALIGSAPITGNQSELVLTLQLKLRQAISIIPQEAAPAEVASLPEFLADAPAPKAAKKAPKKK